MDGEGTADIKSTLDTLKKSTDGLSYKDLDSVTRMLQACSFTPGMIDFFVCEMISHLFYLLLVWAVSEYGFYLYICPAGRVTKNMLAAQTFPGVS